MSNQLTAIDPPSEENLPVPKATHGGELHIADTAIKCYVLEPVDGQEPLRVLSGRTVTSALGLVGRSNGMNRFLTSEQFRPKMSEKLVRALQDPIRFTIPGVSPEFPVAYGYEAWILPELCWAILDANDEKPLMAAQQRLVAQAKVISRAFAVVGIAALVDEVTGYQDVRDRLALQKILEKYISQEMLPYVTMFPEEFYQQLFKLLGWQWRGMSVPKPSYIGKLTDDLVYKRLAPGVRDALREVTPRNDKGQLKHKLHQHLTVEEGREALRQHLHDVIILMKASTTMRGFERLIARVLPRFGDTMELPLDYGDEDESLNDS